jgi:hypothetical protein
MSEEDGDDIGSRNPDRAHQQVKGEQDDHYNSQQQAAKDSSLHHLTI